LFLPAKATAPPVIALHGCAGPLPRRDDAWARLLAAQGHAVILPDSFASRGLPPDCKAATHGADARTLRRADALAAAAWAEKQPFAPPGGVLLLGWSDGGTTVLAALDDPPPGLIRAAIAFYPACTRFARDAAWRPAAPLLILMGADDDWTPPAPCAKLAAGHPGVKITLYPGAYHDFDVPDDPVHLVTGLPYTKNHDFTAHAGANPAARAAAQRAVTGFFMDSRPATSR
jgi:dienelactone hydrolase